MPESEAPTHGALPTRATPADEGFGWRVAVSITSLFGLVIFILLYLAFGASSFTVVQSGVLVIAALLVFIAANGAAWVGWGIRHSPPAPGAPI